MKPIDLAPYPHWQKLVETNPAYKKLWLAGKFPPIRGAKWDVTQPSRGLGDTIAKIADATGIAKVAKKISKAVGKPHKCCGQKEEPPQLKLNRLVPYAPVIPENAKPAVVFVFYRVPGTRNAIPIQRLDDHFRWNGEFYRSSNSRVYVVTDQPYDVPDYARCLVYPEPLAVFSNARCKNFGIKAAIVSERSPIIATDVDVAYTADAWNRMLAVGDRQAVICTAWLASSYEGREDECTGRAVPFHVRVCRKSHKDYGACGTVAMTSSNWVRVPFEDRLVGYGCDDPLLRRDIQAAGLEITGSARSQYAAKVYHIAHSDAPQANFSDNDSVRTDRWSPDFNPVNFKENRKLYLGRPIP